MMGAVATWVLGALVIALVATGAEVSRLAFVCWPAVASVWAFVAWMHENEARGASAHVTNALRHFRASRCYHRIAAILGGRLA